MEQIKNFRILQGIMQLALAPIAIGIFLYVQPYQYFTTTFQSVNKHMLKIFVWLTQKILFLHCTLCEIIIFEEFGESILNYIL